MKINNISISRFRSLGDNVTIHFSSNQIVLVGQNEAGKSNVIDGLSRIRFFESMGQDVLPLSCANRALSSNSIEVSLDVEFDDEDIALLDGVDDIPQNERRCCLAVKRDQDGLRQKISEYPAAGSPDFRAEYMHAYVFG